MKAYLSSPYSLYIATQMLDLFKQKMRLENNETMGASTMGAIGRIRQPICSNKGTPK